MGFHNPDTTPIPTTPRPEIIGASQIIMIGHSQNVLTADSGEKITINTVTFKDAQTNLIRFAKTFNPVGELNTGDKLLMLKITTNNSPKQFVEYVSLNGILVPLKSI